MSESLAYLLPVIWVCIAIGAGCFLTAAYQTWRKLPDPQAYRTKYGVLVRRK